mmetsp:Transcript_9917/g.17262  ORF Transcript_9917/g.17262 Transcript_9917/m.17262 type:complete len:215 (-) Transcript_9917:294-938(-)|eukprot:CAMPEP_0196655866 /NCGR_PEP_ID=MMETSP1086-20130531/9995_1 /TAXON_ID=77921 /ORGANISM="Cyanoptyche  gloeocystis , Strain SAG4.97" /LENGTH=214 /DNA_ID=CAMNT_0041988391 /DNA_START=90 /DNA_END=734 /DNA_ORIENTATION=+
MAAFTTIAAVTNAASAKSSVSWTTDRLCSKASPIWGTPPSSQVKSAGEAQQQLIASCAFDNEDSRFFSVSRRHAMKELLAAAAALAVVPSFPALAAEDEEKEIDFTQFTVEGREYIKDTKVMIALMRDVIAESSPEKITKTRKAINMYSSLYRRNENTAGRQSFLTMNTAVNSVAGHYNNYGASRPIPKKLKARLEVLFEQAEKALAREIRPKA